MAPKPVIPLDMRIKNQLDVEKWFLERGGKLLSQYQGWNKPIIFECPKCHLEKEYSSFNNISNNPYGPFCHECIEEIRKIKVNEKVILKISNFLQEYGSFLLLPYPKHDKDVVHFICANCRCPSEIVSWHSFNRQRNKCFCKKCQYQILSEERKYPLEKIKKWFLDRNSELVGEYINSHAPILFKCTKCGETEESCSWIVLKTTNKECLCKKCNKERMANELSTPIQEIEEWFKQNNSCLLEYRDSQSKIKFKCSKCGKEEVNFSFGHLKHNNPSCQCKECNKPKGPNHPNWKEELTDEERNKRRITPEYLQWCKDVLKKFNYTCPLSEKRTKITPHHLYNYSDYPKLRKYIWNGICLSDDIHSFFHREYGFGKNTYIQFKQFCQNFFKKEIFLAQKDNVAIDIVSCDEEILKKKKAMFLQGMEYYAFFDYEILNAPEIVDSFINTKLKTNLIKKFGARKFNLREVSSQEASAFYSVSHRQSAVHSKINIALEKEGVIFACMSFSQPRYNFNFQYELTRFAVKPQHIVAGAFSRLFKYFISQYTPESIVSYEDIRFSSLNPNNSVYIKSGYFTLLHQTKPNYWYSKNDQAFSRIQFQKHKLKEKLERFNPALSEKDNVLNNNYRIYYDCGNFVFFWKKS